MKRPRIICPYCGAQALLRPAAVLQGRRYCLPEEEVYVCARYPVCDAYVAAHKASRLPMVTLADKHLRRKRIEAHKSLGRLWQSGLMSKQEAYRWLQVQLGLPPEEAHIAKFSEWRCEQVIRLCSTFSPPHKEAA